MPKVLDRVRDFSSYAFVGIGLVWLAIAFLAGSALLLWPVIACVVGGVLLRLRSGGRLTFAWASSAAIMGLVLSGYQVYQWMPFLGGTFNVLAAESLGGFAAFAVVHFVLLYSAASRPKTAR
jgi:hypothetical protein